MKMTALIPLSIGIAALVGTVPALHGQVRSSANYSMVAETQDGGGDLASSANYSLESSVEPVSAGDSTTSNLSLEHGFLTTGVVVDTSPPVITLAGDAVMTLYAGTDTYSETGATATDLVDGSVAVVIGGDAVDATTPGTYLVTYDATDSEGFAAEQVTRTVYVTRPVYFVDADAPDGGDGSSWASAFNQLQDALDLTAPRTKRYYGNEQEVWVAAGTYYPDEGTGQSDGDRSSTFLVKTGITLYGGFAGTETALNQRDPDTNLTILSGDLDQNDTGVPGAGNAYHVVTMLDPATYTANKGEIDVDTGLDGFTITGGKADGSAPHDTGGGVLATVTGIDTEPDVGTIKDCRILGNAAKNGAGVAMPDVSWLSINASEIRDNHAELDGGGIYVRESNTRLNLSTVRLESNTATRGGGLYFNSINSEDLTASAIVEYCHVRGNHASDTGGGIHVGLGYVRLDTCLISGNAAGGNGGGIFGEEADLELEFSTLAGNRAGGQGGALYGETPGALSCAKTLIWGNEDASGAGAPGGSIAGGVTGSTSFSTSLAEGFAPGGSNLDGTLAANDPAFVAPEAPANAPTVSGDYHLTGTSPVIGLAPGSGLDLDFVARGTPADLGAYEYVSAYSVWAAASGLTPGVNDDPEDDPDGDGCPNWREFAFDGNPLSGTKSRKKRLGMVMVEDLEHLALTIPLRSGAVFAGTPSPSASVDGITYIIEGSSDLEDWTLPVIEIIPADSVGLPALNSGWEYRTFVTGAEIGNAFLRTGLESGL